MSSSAARPHPNAIAAGPQRRAATLNQNNLIAVVLVFAVLAMGLVAGMSYLHSTSAILAGIDGHNQHILTQMQRTNAGLVTLVNKTSTIKDMATGTQSLQGSMHAIDGTMGDIDADLSQVAGSMGSMQKSLVQLDSSVGSLSVANQQIEQQFGAIKGSLATQASSVHQLLTEIVSTSTAMSALPHRLSATNSRLTYVNSVVCQMGKTGVTADSDVHITFIGIPNGSSDIKMTMIPGGGWTC